VDRELSNINEELLYSEISQLIEATQQRTLHEINRAGVLLYWHIGRRINQDILKHNIAGQGKRVNSQIAANSTLKCNFIIIQ
jgi:hypothetical protein